MKEYFGLIDDNVREIILGMYQFLISKQIGVSYLSNILSLSDFKFIISITKPAKLCFNVDKRSIPKVFVQQRHLCAIILITLKAFPKFAIIKVTEKLVKAN